MRFDLDETERPNAQKIAEEIEATYGFEAMPPEVGNLLVEEVEIQGVRYHYFGIGTIYDYNDVEIRQWRSHSPRQTPHASSSLAR